MAVFSDEELVERYRRGRFVFPSETRIQPFRAESFKQIALIAGCVQFRDGR
jgi:hypothetical protein